jgi:hypothetical protein
VCADWAPDLNIKGVPHHLLIPRNPAKGSRWRYYAVDAWGIAAARDGFGMGYLVAWILSCVVSGIGLYKAGPQNPQTQRGSYVIAIGGGFIASVVFMIVVAIIWPIRSDQEVAAAAVEDACRDDWHQCQDNSMLVNDSHIDEKAVVACKLEADQEARYGHPDLPVLAFGNFTQGDSYLKSGVMVLNEPDATFQNGFGAMARATVTCWYDMNKEAVVDMQIEQH